MAGLQARADFRSALQSGGLEKRYLVQFIDWINELEPDVVVVTGDLITGGYRYEPIASS